MITKNTAAQIWQCYREIETAKKILDDMKELRKLHPHDPHARCLKDVFGRAQDLQLGIPSGDTSRRLFNVSPLLAESVILAHISHKEAELVEANEQARIEQLLDQPRLRDTDSLNGGCLA